MALDLTVVSLFAGCGGLDLGFHELGFKTIYAVDHEAAAVKTYRHNLSDAIQLRDVTSSQFHDDLKHIGTADVVLGGFPCQGFSKAGPKRMGDARNALYLEMLRAVKLLQPEIFIAENVDGLGQNFGGAYLQSILSDFGGIGYQVEHRLVDAVAYGVPQHRRRILFVGTRSSDRRFEWPVATHSLPHRNGERAIDRETDDLFANRLPAPRSAARTIMDAIDDLPEIGRFPDHVVSNSWPAHYRHIFKAISPGQKLCNVRHGATSVYTWQIPEVFGYVTPEQRNILEVISKHRRHKRYGDIPNGNPLPLEEIEALLGAKVCSSDISVLLKLGYLKQIDSRYDLKGAMFCSGLFKRPLANEPSPTVLTNFHNPRYFLHPMEDRPFSLRECARLQGFPDSFEFLNSGISIEEGYRLVGNAVPPTLGRVLANSVFNYLAKFYNKQISREEICAA